MNPKNPNDYAIIIGLKNYPGINDLDGPENDARAFRDWVVSPEGGGIPDDSNIAEADGGPSHLQVILSSGSNPPPPFRSTRVAHPVVTEIQNAFVKLLEIYEKNLDENKGPRIGRRLYMYMAGHGISPSASRAFNQYEAALLMADARPNFLGSTYHIPGAYTANWFRLNGCFDEVFLFMDCCRSDESVLAINEFLPDEKGDLDGLAQRPFCYIFGTKWAKNAREKLMPNEGGLGVVRGVFTKTLLDALSGGAVVADPDQPGQGIITVSSLKGYIHKNIDKVRADKTNADDDSMGRSLKTRVKTSQVQEIDVDYGPSQQNDGTDIIVLRVPLAPSLLAVPPKRGIPSPQPPVTLIVRTGDKATEIFIIDTNLERVGKKVGNLAQFELIPGEYFVKVKSGDTQQKQQIDLTENTTVTFEPAVFTSPAPLEGTAKTHEFHVANAAIHSKQKDRELGAGSELYVFVREWTSENQPTETPAKQPTKGLTIRSLSGETLVDMASYELPGETRRDPWKACNMELDPGTYLLTLEKPNGDLIQQTVTTCRGWQTQVFLLLKDYGKDTNSRRADLANASIYMARLGQGFNPQNNTDENATARLTELARQGLVNNRKVLTEATLREVLNSKFDNPMLGIMGGHLLLLEKEVNEELLRVVVDNLRRMLGRTHPDVESLAIQATIESDYVFDAPPMLLSSWSILLRASATKPLIIPENSLANDVADLLWGGSPWLLWTIPKRVSKADAKTQKQQLQEQLKRVISSQQSDSNSMTDSDLMESMIVERDLQLAEPVPVEPPTEEQLNRLVQTMGLPRGKIEQMLKEQK